MPFAATRRSGLPNWQLTDSGSSRFLGNFGESLNKFFLATNIPSRANARVDLAAFAARDPGVSLGAPVVP
jgi:hypothetical protein